MIYRFSLFPFFPFFPLFIKYSIITYFLYILGFFAEKAEKVEKRKFGKKIDLEINLGVYISLLLISLKVIQIL
jgi:hypothetical protein